MSVKKWTVVAVAGVLLSACVTTQGQTASTRAGGASLNAQSSHQQVVNALVGTWASCVNLASLPDSDMRKIQGRGVVVLANRFNGTNVTVNDLSVSSEIRFESVGGSKLKSTIVSQGFHAARDCRGATVGPNFGSGSGSVDFVVGTHRAGTVSVPALGNSYLDVQTTLMDGRSGVMKINSHGTALIVIGADGKMQPIMRKR